MPLTGGRHCPHFVDENTKDQRADLGFKARSMTPTFYSMTFQKKWAKVYTSISCFIWGQGEWSERMQEGGESERSNFHLSLDHLDPKELLSSPPYIAHTISLNPISSLGWTVKGAC